MAAGAADFDNNADTLFVPPILMERYLQAAGEILDAAKPERLFFVRPGKAVSAREAARKILSRYATLGFRRPVDAMEVERLLAPVRCGGKTGRGFSRPSVKFALKAVLVSPNFLFRAEQSKPAQDAYPINDYELASRLSYFLWSSMPDEELFPLAAQKTSASAGRAGSADCADAAKSESPCVRRRVRRAVAAGARSVHHRQARPEPLSRLHARTARRHVRRNH